MAGAVKVAILSRNTIVREALNRILSDAGFTTVQSTSLNHLIAAGLCDGVNVILIVADEWDGETIAPVRDHFPRAKIVLLTSHFDFQKLRSAFQAGVSGYLVKEISSERLIGALRLVAMGEKVFPSQLADELTGQNFDQQDVSSVTIDDAHLSAREVEILRCLIMGLPNKEISRKLSISEATVKVHVKAVLRKLNVSNRTQAAIWGTSHGLNGSSVDEPAQAS